MGLKFLHKYCFFILFFAFAIIGKGQAIRVQSIRVDSAQNAVTIDLKSEYKSPQDFEAALRKTIPQLQENGYLAAAIDSIGILGTNYSVYYFVGKAYSWARLSFDSIPKSMLIAANISEQQYSNRPINPKNISKITERLLSYNENNGYPFTKVWLSNIAEIESQKITATVKIDRAELRKIDSIIVNGDVKISAAFLHRYLDIPKGSIYNEAKIKMIAQRLNQLPFLQETAPWVLSFRPGSTRLALFLKEKKANQLNAILGLMPNNLATQKLLLTADVQIALQNLLGYGESISASYQNLQAKSPRMKADIVQPYIANSAFGAELHFDYFMNNLQFRKVSFQTGIRYQLNTNDFLKLLYQSIGNRIINIDTASILATKQLPANIDNRSSGLGIEWNSNHTDYTINPRKGWYVKLGATALQRRVLTNDGVSGIKDGTGFDYSTLYDSLKGISYQYFLHSEMAKFIPIGKNLTLKFGYNGAYIATPKLFQNELFQIGGFKLLRGFDEQSIFANQYHLFSTELRILLSQNSYAYLFSDNAWVQTKFNNYNREGVYNGFGLGTTLQTKTGLFSIALAFGRSEYNPLKFRESKILFGYVALF